MKRLLAISSLIIIIIFNVHCGSAPKQRPETRIGQFDFSTFVINEAEFTSRYGQGFVVIDKFGDQIMGSKHIYYLTDQNVWLEVRFSHVRDERLERMMSAVLITKNKLCDKEFEPQEKFEELITSRGIRIGDPLNKVIKVYGDPARIINVERGGGFSSLINYLNLKQGVIFRYYTEEPREINFTEFYFDNEELHSLIISVEE